MKLKYIRFAPSQVAELEQACASPKADVATRAMALLMIHRGERIKEVCRVADVVYMTVYRWVVTFLQEGRVDMPHKHSIAADKVAGILDMYYGPPPGDHTHWSFALLSEEWQKTKGTRISEVTMRKIVNTHPVRDHFVTRARVGLKMIYEVYKGSDPGPLHAMSQMAHYALTGKDKMP